MISGVGWEMRTIIDKLHTVMMLKLGGDDLHRVQGQALKMWYVHNRPFEQARAH